MKRWRGYMEVCHCGASMGPAASSELQRNKGVRAARPIQLEVKEALHIQRPYANNRLKCDRGYELPGCWIATMKKLGGGAGSASANLSASSYTPSHAYKTDIDFTTRFTFALRITRASSWNVGKFYWTVIKLSTKNLCCSLYSYCNWEQCHFKNRLFETTKKRKSNKLLYSYLKEQTYQ